MRRGSWCSSALLLGAAVAGCGETISGPKLRPDPATTMSPGAAVVASGVASAGTNGLLELLASEGDLAAARRIAAIRAAHAAALDSALAGKSVVVSAASLGPSVMASATTTNEEFATGRWYDPDQVMEIPPVELGMEYYAPAKILGKNTDVTASGSTGKVFGSASAAGTHIRITLVAETRNTLSGLPGMGSSSIHADKEASYDAWGECASRVWQMNITPRQQSTTVAQRCGPFGNYAEHVWPIDLGQPCGTMLKGHGIFEAYNDYSAAARFLSKLLAPVPGAVVTVLDPGPSGWLPPENTLPQEKWSGDCRAPTVVASLDPYVQGWTKVADGYEATVPPGSHQTALMLATVTDSGVPKANATEIWLDGVLHTPGSLGYEFLFPGTYTFTAKSRNAYKQEGQHSVTLRVMLIEGDDEGVCTDPTAQNYDEPGECVYPEDTCWDPYAMNYGAYGECRYESEPQCNDPWAINYGEYGECSYEEDICWDWYATNYGAYGECRYDEPTWCDDWWATNYGDYGECEYEDDYYCWDPYAANYGETGFCFYEDPCSEWYYGPEECNPCDEWYSGWEPCDDDNPCSDWYTGDDWCEDPCSDNYYGWEECCEDPPQLTASVNGQAQAAASSLAADDCYDWGLARATMASASTSSMIASGAAPSSPTASVGIAPPTRKLTTEELKARNEMLARARKAGVRASQQALLDAAAVRRVRKAYHVVLMDKWQDPSLLAFVRRSRVGNQYRDVIYLPAKNPTSLGWAQAIRTLERDRQLVRRTTQPTRVLRVTREGAEKVRPVSTRRPVPVTAVTLKPLPAATRQVLEHAFQKRILPKLRQEAKQRAKASRATASEFDH